MFQSILGVAVLLIGLAGVLFNKRLAASHRAFSRWAFGLDTSFVPDGDRAGLIIGGLTFAIMGLLIALDVVPTN
jgi:hypothetical protein